jgi:hypothetical protein
MIERPEVKRWAFYRIERIERRQMVRVRQFPHPRYAILPRRISPVARRMGGRFWLRGERFELFCGFFDFHGNNQ